MGIKEDKVVMICNAYESGFGHGFQEDGLVNPHKENTDEFKAYKYGFEEGLKDKDLPEEEI